MPTVTANVPYFKCNNSARVIIKITHRKERRFIPSDIYIFKTDLTIRKTTARRSDNALMQMRIEQVMSENVSNPDFGVEELGKEVGLSRTHLYRKLKQLTNHTAIEFVRDMRLQRAAQLFKQNKLYVAEVAYMSGFKELSYFRKIFREYYGMSPQEYINSCNKL